MGKFRRIASGTALATATAVVPLAAAPLPADAAEQVAPTTCAGSGCSRGKLTCNRGTYGILTCDIEGQALNYPADAWVVIYYELSAPKVSKKSGALFCGVNRPCAIAASHSYVEAGAYTLCVKTVDGFSLEPVAVTCASVSVK